MSNNLLFSVLIAISLFLLSACGTESIPASSTEVELGFFPIDTFQTWEYQMDSVIYDNGGLVIDTIRSFRKEQVMGNFVDVEGSVTYRLGISWKKQANDQWTETDLWTFKLNENGLQRTEENLNFVKLKFPIVEGDFWDGNQFPEDTKVVVSGDSIQVYRNWLYEYVDRVESLEIDGDTYDDVIHVKQADNENLIERRFSEEFYSKGVGLVARNMMILDVQCGQDPNCPPLPWEIKADQGFILTQRLIDYY